MNVPILLNGITIQELIDAIKPLLTPQNPNNAIDTGDELLTREEVCSLLNIKTTCLYNHTKSGKLKSYGIGKRVYYKKNEVLNAVKRIN